MANNVSNFPELHFSSDFYFTVCLHFRDGNRRPRHLSGAPRNQEMITKYILESDNRKMANQKSNVSPILAQK